ncbi:carbohydrate sulfotransferase 11-like isoform X2 [Mixophyes fleayi]|uniref:carbohydrate sulfotransferase 11-like isoform X2 n=1 Tax=Mixophyes fleayi TaxID=3061075 RepID=UPI003F4DF79C
MKLTLRFSILMLLLGIIYLWMMMIKTTPDQETVIKQTSTKEKLRRSSVTYDTFLHVQQLRKKKLRYFCRQFPELNTLNVSDRAEHLLSSMTVSPKLQMVYCKSTDVAIDEWEELIQEMEKRSDVTIPSPLLDYHRPDMFPHQLRDYNLTMLEQVLRTYTKVLFVRDPFQRLVSMYMQDHAGEITFDEFIEDILIMETGKSGVSSSSVISLCHPCFIQYDYIVMYDFLKIELYHLFKRIGAPDGIQLPRSTDTKSKLTSEWLAENFFRGLSKQQINQLAEIYSQDFAAFRLRNSLLWNKTLGTIR